MRESNSQVEVILENIADEFFAVDLERRFTYINRQALLRIEEATGQSLTREDLLGKSVWEMLPEQVGSVFYQKYHEAMREQKTVHFEQYLPPTGEWCEVHAYPSEEGLAVYVQDVTARKQAEERFRSTFERAAVGIAHVSFDGRMLRINEKLCEILGYAREELLNLAVHDVSYPEDHGVDLAVPPHVVRRDRLLHHGESLREERSIPGLDQPGSLAGARSFGETGIFYRGRRRHNGAQAGRGGSPA